MKRNYKYLPLCLIISFVAISCSKFLDVQPQDKYTEEQVFANEKAVQQVLNGLYFNLASSQLYGATLTNTTVELLAQRYYVPTGYISSAQRLQTYTYTDEGVMNLFNSLWTSTFANIAKANKFIASLELAANEGIIARDKAALLRGEALAIRAMLHFDMLRLFGPVITTTPASNAIPYYSKADALTRPILPATQVIDSVLADLSAAKTLLAADPVITKGIVAGTDFYTDNRHLRLNYYAITALQARVYLYAGNRTAANQAARQALTEGEKWFPWVPFGNVINNTLPDRIFSTEVLFGVFNQDMYTVYTTYFAPDLNQYNILIPFPARLKAIYENVNLLKDYRYLSTFKPGGPPIGSTQETGLTFNKYADVTDLTKPWRFVQPLIRKSELYYILAETETTPSAGMSYLNTVRFNRGLADLADPSVLAAEIQKEYQKEFWGEGQLFFYYKRLAKTTVPSAISELSNVTMNAVKYVVPLPLAETTPR